MTILDVNILIYAHDADAPQHPAVMSWLTELFAGPESVGLPLHVLWGFLRISTNRQIQSNPRTPQSAFHLIRDWLNQPRVVLVHPGPQHFELLESLVIDCQASGTLVSDAALAALAIEHGAVLASADRDFSRFPNLRWVNPLEAQ